LRRVPRIITNKSKKRVRVAKSQKPLPSKTPSLSPKQWVGKMKDIPCFIMGNAPSLNNIKDFSIFDNYLTVGINRIFYKYDPTILIWQDLALWTQERKRIVNLESIKYCRDGADTRSGSYVFKLKGRAPKLSHSTTELYGRGSSGSIAYQFTHALGCNPIILVGIDCCYDKTSGDTDFYGSNSMHRKHTLPDCEKGLKFIKLNPGGRKIINCSPNKVFEENLTIEEVVKTLGDKKYNREELKNILLS
jgi:hypothetical protein